MAVDLAGWVSRRSLKTRVTASATALLALVLTVGVLTLVGLERRSLVRQVDSALDNRITGILDDIQQNRLLFDVAVTGREVGVVQVIDQNGLVRAATPGMHNKPRLNVFAAPTTKTMRRSMTLEIDTADPDPWRVAGRRVVTDSDTYDIYVATSLLSVDRAVSRLRLTLLGGVPILIALFAMISWYTTRWSLRPVEQVAETVDRTEPDDLAGRVPLPAGNDEIVHLVRTMNALLDRVANARQRERRFAADASHELRTPLTTARLNLEIAQVNPTIDGLNLAVDRTLGEIERLETLARDLLELTRLDSERVRSQAKRVDVSELVRTEVQVRAARYDKVDYRLDAPTEVMATVVTSLILRVIRNLLDNAERFAVSEIDVVVTTDGATVAITVHNDGPPIPAADRRRVFDAFTRLDESRTREDGGTGLGLAIALDIVEAHHGTIGVIDDTRNGATFRVSLPAVSGASQTAST